MKIPFRLLVFVFLIVISSNTWAKDLFKIDILNFNLFYSENIENRPIKSNYASWCFSKVEKMSDSERQKIVPTEKNKQIANATILVKLLKMSPNITDVTVSDDYESITYFDKNLKIPMGFLNRESGMR